MNPLMKLKHEFVESFPDDLKSGVIYISVVYATAAHKCCCGCGEKVVTPISPKGWILTFDGEAISLRPSIGNRNFICQSHYWIEGNKVIWVDDSLEDVVATKADNASVESKQPGSTVDRIARDPAAPVSEPVEVKSKESLWQKAKKWKWW